MYAQASAGKPREICIIGSGHAGVCTAVRLMRHARGPMNIHMFDRIGIGGVGYGQDTVDTGHLLNLQAGRVPILREDPEHFVRWLQYNSGFSGLRPGHSSAVNRRDYGKYCWDTLWNEAKHQPLIDGDRRPLVNLYYYSGNATGFTEDENGKSKVSFDGNPKLIMSTEGLEAIRHREYLKIQESGMLENSPLSALLLYYSILPPLPSECSINQDASLPAEYDALVLATGHLEVKIPTALKNAGYTINDPTSNVIVDQYTTTAFRMMDDAVMDITGDDMVLIIGTALSALDPVLSIVRRCEALGRELPNFVLCSRHGHSHFTYASDHKHRALRLTRPEILNGGGSISLEQLIEEVPKIWAKATAEALEQDGIAIKQNPRLLDERILKALEPYIPEVIKRMSADDIKKGYAEWASFIATRRIGVVPEVGNVIDGLAKVGKLTFIAGECVSYVDGKATIQLKGGEELVVCPKMLVNSIGRNFDYSNTTNTFWKGADLLPDQIMGIGVELTDDSLLVRENHKPYKNVRVVGAASIGKETTQFGRTGAFAQSQGPIKVRAMRVAHDINFLISNPIPQVIQFLEFEKANKGDLLDFLQTLTEDGQELSADFKGALSRLENAFNSRCNNMIEQLYAEAHGKWPSQVMQELEMDVALEWLPDIPDFANGCGVVIPNEVNLLGYAMHIILEQQIASAKERCCDLTQGPDVIKNNVMGL